jgi:hypothetical protein
MLSERMDITPGAEAFSQKNFYEYIMETKK